MDQAAIKTSKIRRETSRDGAKLTGTHDVEVTTSAGKEHVKADGIILATGSSPVFPSLFPANIRRYSQSDNVFSIDYLPAHLVVVGGGYIGSELACAFQGLGSKVTLIEKEKSLLATQPEFQAAAPVLQRSFEKRGMTVCLTNTEVKSVNASDGPAKLLVTCANGESIEANALLLALGRRPNVENLGLEAAGITVQGGRFTINEFLQSREPHIYAIGDLVSPLPLAHTAAKEGETGGRSIGWAKPQSSKNELYAAIPQAASIRGLRPPPLD